MKSVLVVFLFVALASCFDLSTLTSILNKEKRGGGNAGVCFPTTCGGVGDHCLSPTDIPACGTDCAIALGQCVEANQGVQTCACTAAAVACLNATQSGECLFASFAYYSQCVSGLLGNCQPNECGVPPATFPPVPTCINSFCEDQTCQALGDTGAACLTSDECIGICNNGTCLTYPMMGPGDMCTSNEQCYTFNCTNNVCVGLPAGASCAGPECAAGHYCNAGTCAPLVTPGGACDSSDACGTFGLCKGGMCIPLYSTLAGASCTDSEECTFGYVCGPAGTCIPYQRIVPEGTCSTNSECTTAYGISAQCSCNTQTGGNFCAYTDFLLPQCASLFSTMVSCLNMNGCGFNPLPGSCATVHCSNEVNCALGCLMEVDDAIRPVVASGCFPFSVGTCQQSTTADPTTTANPTTTAEATTTGASQGTTDVQGTTGPAATTAPATTTKTADDSSASSVVLSFFTLFLILVALF